MAPGQPQTMRNVSLTKQAAILLGVFLLFLILRYVHGLVPFEREVPGAAELPPSSRQPVFPE